MRFMGENDERFLAAGDSLARTLIDRGLQPDFTLLDVGCGYGRLAFGLIRQLDFVGRYEGFDPLPRHIQWSSEAITGHSSNFRFRHLDVANDRYNRRGSIAAASITFPFSDATFDMCVLFSVFTHMYEADIRRYMAEIRRVIKETGTCVATFFLFSDHRLAAVTSDRARFPMRHQLDETTRFFNPQEILHAIAYDEGHVREMWERAGLHVEDTEWGSWAGDQQAHGVGSDQDTPPFQDVMTVTCR
jgi:SAM-dependent methyltransferase